MVCASNDDEGGKVAINQEPLTIFIDIPLDTVFIHGLVPRITSLYTLLHCTAVT